MWAGDTPAAFRGRILKKRAAGECLKLSANSVVTLARDGFQTLSVEYLENSPAVRDQPLLAKAAGRSCHRRPTNAEHLRKERMSQGEAVAVDAIVNQQKPARASLPLFVEVVAGAGLRDEQQKDLGVLMKQVAKG